MSHKPYNPAGGNTWKKKRKANSGHTEKGRPGSTWSFPYKCKEQDLHNHFPDAVLIGPHGKVLR